MTRSARLLGLISDAETLSAEQGAEFLGHMNMMLEFWTENDIELGWFEQSLTTDAAPLPKWAERGVVSKLAQTMQAVYPSTSLAPWVLDDELNGFGAILRRSILDNVTPSDMSGMPSGSGRVGSSDYDITSGE